MPGDPLIDEERVYHLLSSNEGGLTPNGVRSLMSCILLACYDRKVTREFMAEMIDINAEVGILLSNMEGAAKLRGALMILKPGVPTTEIDAKIEALCDNWREKRAVVAGKFARLMQCPTSEDRIS